MFRHRTAARVLALAAVALAVTPRAAAAAPVPQADVNGDGIGDLVLATGARLTYLGDTALTPNDLGGSVLVIPGGVPAAMVNQNSAGVGLGMTATDKFGAALATGDFNGDGYADLGVLREHAAARRGLAERRRHPALPAPPVGHAGHLPPARHSPVPQRPGVRRRLVVLPRT